MNRTMRSVFWFVVLGLSACQPNPTAAGLAPTETPSIQPTLPSAAVFTEAAPQETASVASATPESPMADRKPVYVTAFCTTAGQDKETIIPAGTPVVIVWGWEAKTNQQIQDFLESSQTVIKLDGKTVTGTLNSDVKVNEKSGRPEVAWFFQAGVLAEGAHVIIYDVTFKKMIDDGSGTYGPGGKTESLHDECLMTVR